MDITRKDGYLVHVDAFDAYATESAHTARLINNIVASVSANLRETVLAEKWNVVNGLIQIKSKVPAESEVWHFVPASSRL